MPAKAYSYKRFSSPKQAEGDSLRRQTEGAEDYCRRRGLILDTSLRPDAGISAWKGDNADTGALSGFLGLCRQGKIEKGSFLIVEHLDRLTRQHVRKALTLFFEILDAGVTIVTLQPEREYTPEFDKDPLSLIEPLMLFAGANEKSETLSKRLRDTWSEKRKQRKPMTRWTPAWIRLTGDRSAYELIPEKAEIVRKMVLLALNGYGDIRLARKMNDEKWPVISDHSHWTNAYVSKIMRSVALIGGYEPGVDVNGKRVTLGEVWDNYFPSVISTDEWYRLRASRKLRTTQRGPTGIEVANLFSGILLNTRDGQRYQRIVKNHARLVSASFRNGLSGGDTQSFAYEPLESAFLLAFAHELKLSDVFGQISDEKPASSLDNLTAELMDVQSRIAVVQERLRTQANFTSLIDVLADLDRRKGELVTAIEEEKARQSSVGREEEAFTDLQALAQLWGDGVQDKSDLRTRIKSRIRQLVAEIWMAVYGKKRSKFKTAELQIHFRAGGSKVLIVNAETENLTSTELLINSATECAILPRFDFRLYRDDEKGNDVRAYVEMMTEMHLRALR